MVYLKRYTCIQVNMFIISHKNILKHINTHVQVTNYIYYYHYYYMYYHSYKYKYVYVYTPYT